MGKIVESTFVTLDGVMGNPQDWGSAYWDDDHAAYAGKLHVASTTLTDTTWNAGVLDGDAIDAVRELKEQDGDLLKFGTGDFSRALFHAGLVDEFHFWVFPVVAGSGQRLFEGLDLTHLKLLDSTTFASGIVVHVLAPQ